MLNQEEKQAKAYGENAPTERPSQIKTQIDMFEEQVNEFSRLLNLLRGKLKPVLRELREVPNQEQKNPEEEKLVSVAQLLKERNAILRVCNKDLGLVIDSVEL